MRKPSLSLAAIALAANLLAVESPTLPSACQAAAEGCVKIGALEVKAAHFGPSWINTLQGQGCVRAESGYPKSADGVWTLKGVWTVAGGEFAFEERLARLSELESSYELSVKSSTPVSSNELSLLVALPADEFAGRQVSVDGKRTTLPAELSKAELAREASFSAIEIPGSEAKIRIEGKGSFLLQDDRQFNGPAYALRLGLSPSKGEIKEASIKLKISVKPYESKAIPLLGAANMGFADEAAGDGKGGWTDQGPDNDLRMIKPGPLKYGGVSFNIADPAKNGGRACAVLGSARIPGLPETAKIEAGGLSAKHLFLLHALAWPPSTKTRIGTLGVCYRDGTRKDIPLVYGVDIGNWWNPSPVENAMVAWTGENKSAYVGLYMTSCQVEEKPIERLELAHEGSSAWMLAAISASSDEIPKGSKVPTYIIEGRDWKPIELPKDVEAGSALDFSGMLDAPAGKHGRLIAKDGKFAFEGEPSKAVRLYGVNLCFSANYLEKADCDKLAARLAAAGYNAVRMHHHDNQLAAKGAPGTTSLDAASADKLDYLFSALKAKGIYVTSDLFVSRDVKKGEIPEIGRELTMRELSDYKALVMILDSARRNWEEFARSFLNHVNPYTGLAWKDDPALTSLSLLNEDNIIHTWKRSPDVKALYEAKFEAWLESKGLRGAKAKERDALMNRFLTETYEASFAKMRDFLISIGAKQPLSDQNMCEDVALTLMRDSYDYVDNHFYWDHPQFPLSQWSFPSTLQNRSATESMASTPGSVFPTRIFGKPFTVSEFNWAYPCAFRAESGALTGAYASLQGWDALYRFAYAHSSNRVANDEAANYFDAASDPITMMSDRIGVLLFARGDVKSSELEIPVLVGQSWKDKIAKHPKLAWQIGLVGKTGAVVEREGSFALPDGAKAALALEQPCSIPGLKTVDLSAKGDDDAKISELKSLCKSGKGELDIERKFARSSTGELELDGAAKTFKAVTPRSETFSACGKGQLNGAAVSIANKGAAATFLVAAIDGKKIAESKRLLVLHLTDAMNSKVKFSDRKMTVLESYGTLPHLARRGEADIRIAFSSKSEASKVYAIDLGGRRIAELEAQVSADGALSFKADTFAFKTPCMAYEITR